MNFLKTSSSSCFGISSLQKNDKHKLPLEKHDSSRSILRPVLAHPENQGLRLFRHLLRIFLGDLPFLLQLSESLVHLNERGEGSPHFKEHNAQRVYISKEVILAFAFLLFGCHISRGPDAYRVGLVRVMSDGKTSSTRGSNRMGRRKLIEAVLLLVSIEFLILGLGEMRRIMFRQSWVMMLGSQTEISQFHIGIFIQEDVGRLKVTMDEAQTVQIVQGVYYLAEYFPFLMLRLETWILIYEVSQVIAFTILHLDVQNLDTFLLILVLLVTHLYVIQSQLMFFSLFPLLKLQLVIHRFIFELLLVLLVLFPTFLALAIHTYLISPIVRI